VSITSKVIQASAVLLKEHGQQMSRLRLLKLLYMADRESIRQTGHPITLTTPVAMDNGPLSSEVYDFIKSEHAESEKWSRYFNNKGIYVRMLADPGVQELSRFEIQTLKRIAAEHEDIDDDLLVEKCHKFQEWIKNAVPGSSKKIPFADIMDAVDFPQAERAESLSELDEIVKLEKMRPSNELLAR